MLLSSVAAAEERRPADPTPEQLGTIRAAVEKLGGRFDGPLGTKGSQYAGITLHRATDATLKELPDVPFTFHLSVGPMVTEDALAELKRFKTLSALNLRGKNWTGTHWKDLAGLDSLTELHIEMGPNVGDVDWKPLRQLRSLSLSRTQATGAGLNELPNLETLFLHGSKINDAGLRDIGRLKQLTRLALDATAVTDAGLKELAGLENLAQLNMEFSQVSGSGFKELAGLKNLNELILDRSPVTDEGLAGLKA